ncbi:MAG TPA: hypothetical protein DCX29_01685 [Hyphomonas sp.]|nr:hypothetical protein [Hyphomonas sp.]
MGIYPRNGSTRMNCSVDDCDGAVAYRGMCTKHYNRLRRHGRPDGGRTEDGSAIKALEARSKTGNRGGILNDITTQFGAHDAGCRPVCSDRRQLFRAS